VLPEDSTTKNIVAHISKLGQGRFCENLAKPVVVGKFGGRTFLERAGCWLFCEEVLRATLEGYLVPEVIETDEEPL
jgi:hypothetical protein